MSVQRCKPSAQLPVRAHPTDAGFDVTIVDVLKKHGDVTFFGTGIQVCPPDGFYFDLVPRSSISKTGYILANSVGIIDPGYTGEIIVALRKIDQGAKDLELPIRIAQLIPRRIHSDIVLTECFGGLKPTDRGDGGFGSTTTLS